MASNDVYAACAKALLRSPGCVAWATDKKGDTLGTGTWTYREGMLFVELHGAATGFIDRVHIQDTDKILRYRITTIDNTEVQSGDYVNIGCSPIRVPEGFSLELQLPL